LFITQKYIIHNSRFDPISLPNGPHVLLFDDFESGDAGEVIRSLEISAGMDVMVDGLNPVSKDCIIRLKDAVHELEKAAGKR
jgi:hypothetical protein